MIKWTTIDGALFAVRINDSGRETTETPADAKRALRDLIARETDLVADLQQTVAQADAGVRLALLCDDDPAPHRTRAAEALAGIVAAHDRRVASERDLAAIDEHVDSLAAAEIHDADAARIAALIAQHPIPKEF